MTKNLKLEKTNVAGTGPKKKLTRKEKDEAFRLMNENWAKGMDLYLAALDRQKNKEDVAE